ncbi:tyrosine-protein phosphatase [Myroides sp. LJL119]
MNRILYLVLLLCILQSCSYKHTYQPIVFSDLTKAPQVIQQNNKYYAEFENQDVLLGKQNLVITNNNEYFLLKKGQRDIYPIVTNGDSIWISNRLIDLKKVSNFRDLGGLVNQDQRRIIWGKFYRSGQVNDLKKSKFSEFKKLGITTVVDLRTDKEIARKPDNLPKDVTYLNYQAYQDSEDMFSKTRKDVLKGKISPATADSLVVEFYGLYATENPQEIRKIITTILDNPDSTLFHCSAGKDRTGMIAAILLSILKVDKQIIMQDYLLSNNYREKQVASRMKLAKFGKLFFPNLNYQVVETFSWIKPIFLESMFESITKKYGSMDSYIENELQISPKQRQAYLDIYTQDDAQQIKELDF